MTDKKEPAHRAKGALKIALKLFFVGVVFYFLGKKGLISIEATGRAFSHPGRVLPACAALFLTMGLGAVRWQWLLRAQGISLRMTRTLQLVMIGQFFNIALPGAVSGDFVKAFYVANEVQGQRGRAFGSILFDRIVGLSALVLVSSGALLLNVNEFWGTPLFQGVRYFAGAAAAGVIIFYAYLFLVKDSYDPIALFLKRLEERFVRAGSLVRIYEGAKHYHHHRWTVFKALSISILIHLLVGYACIQFAYAMGETHLAPTALLVVIPLGLLVTAVPVLPAGVGTGHAAFSGLFHLLGSQRGADVFSFYVLVQLSLGAIGGLVYLRYRGAKLPAPEVPAAGF